MTRFTRLLARVVPPRLLRLFEGFWTVPVLLALLGMALGAGLAVLPERMLGWRWERSFDDLPIEVARLVLGTVATGVMTAASIVFSLTFLALSMTAQQLSPRVLDYVLRDRAMQVMIGMALATFLFCIVALMAGGAEPARTGLAAALSVPLGAATLLLVVVFAHRMTRTVRADEMVARLGDACVAAMRRCCGAPAGCVAAGGEEPDFAEAAILHADRAGYAGAIDHAALVELAAARNLRIRLEVRPNDFVLPGQPLARVLGLHPGAEVPSKAIAAALNLTGRRAPGFEADYEAASLSEAAIRALSPGINDPATARAALNRLFEGLTILATGEEPKRLIGKEAGLALVVRPVRGVAEMLGEVVAPIAESAARDTQVTRRLIALLDALEAAAPRPADRAAVAGLRAAVEAGEPGKAVAAPGA